MPESRAAPTETMSKAEEELADLLDRITLRNPYAKPVVRLPPPPPPADEPSEDDPAEPGEAGVDVDLAIELCNHHFRISRCAAQLEDDGVDSKELRGIQRAVNRIVDALEDTNVEWIDVTGQRFDDGRTDFEPLGDPERDATVTVPTIVRCERPAVFVGGKLVQKARGLVAIPDRGEE